MSNLRDQNHTRESELYRAANGRAWRRYRTDLLQLSPLESKENDDVTHLVLDL